MDCCWWVTILPIGSCRYSRNVVCGACAVCVYRSVCRDCLLELSSVNDGLDDGLELDGGGSRLNQLPRQQHAKHSASAQCLPTLS